MEIIIIAIVIIIAILLILGPMEVKDNDSQPMIVLKVTWNIMCILTVVVMVCGTIFKLVLISISVLVVLGCGADTTVAPEVISRPDRITHWYLEKSISFGYGVNDKVETITVF